MKHCFYLHLGKRCSNAVAEIFINIYTASPVVFPLMVVVTGDEFVVEAITLLTECEMVVWVVIADDEGVIVIPIVAVVIGTKKM